MRAFENEVILCVANLAQSAQAVELDLARFKGRVPVELSGRNAFPPIGELPYFLTLPAHSFFWLELSASHQAPSWHVERLPASELPVLVDFGASWCPPCRAIAPSIDALARDFAGRVKVATVDVDAEPELAELFEVRSVPTLVMVQGGRVLEQRIGAAPHQVLHAFVEKHASPQVPAHA